MVNKEISTKQEILSILRNSSAPVSGEMLAENCGVSRVAVWKAVQVLQGAGYVITSGRNGYSLEKDLPDSIFPWEFGRGESTFIHLQTTDSTMNMARKLAEQDSGFQIVTADRQTQGKGHGEHKWATTKGALAFTAVTGLKIPCAESHRVTMSAQIAMAEALSEKSGRRISLRWPNDIWTDEGKTGGILDEFNSSGGICRWLNIGIGVNLSSAPELRETDCAFRDASASRKDIVNEFMERFSKTEELRKQQESCLSDKWNSMCMDLGKTVRTQSGEGFIFRGCDGYGWAILEESDGSQRKAPPGTFSFIKQSD